MIVEPDFCDHWKTRMLVGLLNGDEAAPIYVLRIWAHCQNRRQSRFDNLPAEALKAMCRYPGEAIGLDSALKDAGFIERDGNCITVVNWDHYNAGMIASWRNGLKGGRPPKVKESDKGPTETQAKPSNNPQVHDRRGEEGNGEESIGEDKNISSRKDRSADRGKSPSTQSPRSTGNFSKGEEAEASPDEPKPQLDLSHVNWDEVIGLAHSVAKSVPPLTQADRRAWLKYAVMATTCCSEFWFSNAAMGALSKSQRGGVTKTKHALFVGALKKTAKDTHDIAEADFDAIFRAIEIPIKVWKSDCLPIGEPQKRKRTEDDE